MPITLDEAILEFKELVKLHQSRVGNPSPPPLTQEQRYQIGRTVDTIAEFAVGYQKGAVQGLPLSLTVESMRCVRTDIYERLKEEGIDYAHVVADGMISCVLTDEETGATMHVGLSNRFDHGTLQRLSLERMMERVSLH